MTKAIIWIIVIGAIILGTYSISMNKKDKVLNEQGTLKNSEEVTTEPKPAGKKMAFSEFAKQGGSYQCNVNQSTGDFESKGTVYISEGKMRGEFSTIAEGMNVKSYILMKDGFMYTWSSAAPTFGVKMAIKAETQVNNPETYTWDPKQIGDYDCAPWTVDESKFTPPTSVNFKVIS